MHSEASAALSESVYGVQRGVSDQREVALLSRRISGSQLESPLLSAPFLVKTVELKRQFLQEMISTRIENPD